MGVMEKRNVNDYVRFPLQIILIIETSIIETNELFFENNFLFANCVTYNENTCYIINFIISCQITIHKIYLTI